MATSDTNVKLSNVIGAPFSDYVLLQLYQRAAHNSTLIRSNEDVLFLANKTSWARLVSSVNITNDSLGLVYKDLGVNYSTPEGLAQNWILEAGTSKQKGNGIELRYGIGPDGAYGLGGTDELGYRPMPGLTSVQIETTGRLGSLRQATIQFKVWNMDQLDVVEALYFRLGYSMLLEWGHTQYFENTGGLQRNVYGIDDPFKPKKRKEQIQQAIALKARNSFGNYDGMLGVVSNFTWAMNQDAGYDCTVRLVGLGAVMDSMRINQAYKLPKGSLKQYLKNKSELAQFEATARALAARLKYLEDNPVTKATGSITLDPLPKNPGELQALAVKFDNYPAANNFNPFLQEYGIAVYKDKSQFSYFNVLNNVKPSSYSYYIPFNKNPDPPTAAQVTAAYGGLYLNVPGIGFKGFRSISTFKLDIDLIESAIANSLIIDDSSTSLQSKDIQDKIFSERYRLNTEGNTSNLANYFSLQTATRETITTTGALLKGLQGTGAVLGAFDLANLLGIGTETQEVSFSDLLTEAFALIVFSNSSGPQGQFNTRLTIQASTPEVSFRPTRGQIVEALQTWINKGAELSNVAFLPTNGKKFEISGTFTENIGIPYNGPESNRDAVVAANPGWNGDKTFKLVPVTYKITTNNPGFIKEVTVGTELSDPVKKPAGSANTGDINGTVNKASTEQVEADNGFASALQAMLITIQASAQVARGRSGKPYQSVDIKEATSKFFQEGIMNGVLDEKGIPKKILNPSTSEFNLVQYAAKGFNSQLMIDPTLYNNILSVQFDKLCTAFIVAYNQGGTDAEATKLRAPVYISFGYLLAFLNNMCLIYDSPESKVPTNNILFLSCFSVFLETLKRSLSIGL